ncbi:hypothetical protein NBRC111894_4177 [Sporolactobacillus inulinus]|uniref:Uncharacterized protein n=1 Tax=Sporolactobacillus inulinus TaxID=2078 RepID=A0A4Y1ZI27_9BACL|nr:hypothetical protein [Sporolactobacillus inulinus]GAY78623.1 hypothetical protein NBRC111894_4177 [Sporolactobacillus inulinus]
MTFNRIGLKLGAAIMTLMIVILFCLGLAVDRLFVTFYDAQMREDTQELADHLIRMIESGATSSPSTIRTFAEFSNASVYWLKHDGRILAFGGKNSHRSHRLSVGLSTDAFFQMKMRHFTIGINRAIIFMWSVDPSEPVGRLNLPFMLSLP